MIRFRTTLAVALLVAGSAFASGGELDGALEAFKKGDYKAVVEAGARIGATSPERGKVLYLAGEAHLLLGRAAEAETTFRAVLAAKSSVPARVGLGRALTALGKHEEADKELRAAVAADPKDARAHLALGESLLAAKRLDDAKKSFDEAAKLSPGDPWIARGQVELALAQDDDKDAARIAKSLSKSKPEHPMGPFLSAVVLERQGKDDDAIESYEKALALDDAFLDAHKNLAILCHTMSATYSNVERVKKSLAHYERYFALGGKDPELETYYKQMKQFIEPMIEKGGASK
jgi:tetratricopeptide (TPR) repeat protein